MEQDKIYALYEKHRQGIFRYAFFIVRNRQTAEDVLHDTFEKMLTKGGHCAPGKEQAWLYRVARNRCFDLLKKAKWEQAYIEPPSADAQRYAYIDLIATLSPKDQELVTLKIVGGLSHREVGAVLGITAKAAQKRYERIIDELRREEE